MAKQSRFSDENGHLLDLQSLVDQIISTGLDPSVFDVDLDVRFAKNVIDFAVGPEFMNMNSLWAKQAEQAVRLFCEYCPTCSDQEFLENVPVDASVGTFRSKVVLLEHGVCPQCKKNKCELFDKLPWELVSCLGQRSGKTALTGGVIVPYYIHRFLELRNPARFYGLMSNAFFEVTFVAVTAGQIKRTLWQAFKEAIAQSPWFTDYIAKLRQVEREKGFDKGTLVKVMDSYIWFGNKQLGCSYAAADMKSLRGSTRVLAAIDELGWFNANKEAVRANSDETYAALSNSLRTVRSASDRLWKQGEYKTMPAIMANISSPSSQYDKMMSLLKEGERDKRKVCFHLASWEASPLITRESLETEEQNNPVKFWRDFGAVPPLADSPFIESARAIADMQTPNKPLISWRVKFIKDKIDPERNRYVAADIIGTISDSRARMVPRCIAVDCGETQNSFAVGIYHLEPAGGEDGSRFHLVVDAIIEAKPEKILETGEIIPVHFPTMFSLVKTLCDRNKGLHVKAVLYDRWQSTGQIQELRDMKVKAEKYSPKEADFKNLRNLVYGGNLKMPRWEHKDLTDLDITDVDQIRQAPYTHMAVQFATVRGVGKKIIKPEAGDDDLFRTTVLASWYMTENQKDFLVKVQGTNSGQTTRVGALALKSAGLGTYRGNRARTSIGAVRGKTSFYGRR
jgi:hypothetical protein